MAWSNILKLSSFKRGHYPKKKLVRLELHKFLWFNNLIVDIYVVWRDSNCLVMSLCNVGRVLNEEIHIKNKFYVAKLADSAWDCLAVVSI